jgi:hypothetical protein
MTLKFYSECIRNRPAEIYVHVVIHPIVWLTTGPWPLPKKVLHRVRSSASSFNLHNRIFSLRSSSSCLRFLPRLPVTSILPSTGLKYISEGMRVYSGEVTRIEPND